MTDERKKVDSFKALSIRGRFAKERRVTEASSTARDALAGVQRALGELGRRCADVADAKAKLVEAESAIASVTDEAQRKTLEASLERARVAVAESERVCGPFRKR